MEKINVIINGKTIITTPEKTILQLVREKNLDTIPTLCHDERLSPYGSCFLCVVEIEGMKKLLPSCTTRVTNGMKIITNSRKIALARKTALELLLSNHYADCIGPCTNNCPAGVDAQSYIALIAKGEYRKALKLVKENNPLPLSISRVCVRDCEIACRRKILDEPVAINFLKRFIADTDLKNPWKPDIKDSINKSVAIVGGGPAGLTCAYYLRKKGLNATIFEKHPHLGGMLRYGIPEYRLPKKILDAEIQWILNSGINVKLNQELGKNLALEELRKKYNAVYLALGAQKASTMRLEYENETEGVIKGIEFLRNTQIHGKRELKGTVIVVGGGNTAIDAARTALRSGSKEVKIVYRRSIKEMPAHEAEITAALEEGIEILFLTNPKKILRRGNRLTGIECLKMELVEPDDGGRPKPVAVKGSEFDIKCNFLIGAIGQKVDPDFNNSTEKIELEKWGTVIVNENTFQTSLPGVFSGGDLVTGPFTAITAISHGKKAADSISHYLLTGKEHKPEKKFYSFKHIFNRISESELANWKIQKREKMPELNLNRRLNNFSEVDLGFSESQSQNECKRCMECGCSEYTDCSLRKYADDFDVDITKFIGETRKYKIDARHPFITLDPNKCINCGKCIRTCSEMLKVSALGFVYRGFHTIAKPAMEMPLTETNCISCGNCIDACPTGAITQKYPFKVLGTLPKENRESICNFCSLGCKVNYKKIDNDIYYIANDTEEIINNSPNKGYLCIKGRFGHRYLQEQNRILTPLVKVNGQHQKTTLPKALETFTQKIKEITAQYGPESIAVFASPKMSNEELYLVNKLARAGLKTNNITSFTDFRSSGQRDSLDNSLGITTSTTTFTELQNSDLIIIFNTEFSEENVIIEHKIKSAQKEGAKIIEISSSESKLTKFADLWLDTKRGTNTVLLNGLIKEVLENNLYDKTFVKNNISGLDELTKSLQEFDSREVLRLTGLTGEKYKHFLHLATDQHKKITFITNVDSTREKSSADIKATANFMLLTHRIGKENNGIILLRKYCNSAGLMDMGISPRYLPGYVKTTDKKGIALIEKIWDTDLSRIFTRRTFDILTLRNNIKGIIIFKEDPYSNMDFIKNFNNCEFLAVCDSFKTETCKEADIIFPASTMIEQSGTYTTCDRIVQFASAVIPPKSGYPTLEIIAQIGKSFGLPYNRNIREKVFEEIQKANPYYNNLEFKQPWEPELFNKGYADNISKPKFETFTVDTLAQNLSDSTLLFSEKYFQNKIISKLML